MNNKTVPMLDLGREYEYMKEEIDSALKKCLSHQRWIFGPEVKELEDALADYLGVQHCMGVSSGTDALVLSLRALAIQLKGEEFFSCDDYIITTPFTFVATADAILRSGASPLFIDIDLSTCNLDVSKISTYLSSYPDGNVRGIVPVHLYGQSCLMGEIEEIAQKFNLFVVEDVAQAFGASYMNKKLGSFGTTGAFSFFPSKNLGAFGDGGLISTGNSEIAEIVRMLIRHGGKDKYNVDHIGYNARLDTIQAAVVLSRLKYIDEFNSKRRQIAALYTQALSDIEELQLPSHRVPQTTISDHVYHQYTIRTSQRDQLKKYLSEKGISSMIYYPYPLHHMKVFKGRMAAHDKLTNTETAVRQVLSLPIEPLQTGAETEYVIEWIWKFYGK